MKLVIKEKDNRLSYKRAKQEFKESGGWIRGVHELKDFWKLLGEHNNMKVIIKEWQGPYPVVEALEFNTEADYVWFLLRYS